MIRLPLIFLYVLLPASTWAQTLQVRDLVTSTPIPAAVVSYEERLMGVTNQMGQLLLIPDWPDSARFTIRHVAYRTAEVSWAELKRNQFRVFMTESIVNLDEIVLAANKWEQEKKHIPNQIAHITRREIAVRNPQTAADLLGLSGQVFIQKSQMGGGSPIIRGFTANSLLIVVDGVRMNNAIYRGGNLHNVISIDANALESSEVVFGPGSVIYGSDALGGVMDFHTLNPEVAAPGQSANVFGSSLLRYSSANAEKTGHLMANVGLKKWAFLTSFTLTDYDDLRAGSRRPAAYPDFGKRVEYVVRVGETDQLQPNPNPNVQKGTAYQQGNLMQKIHYQPHDRFSLTYAFHYSNTSDIPRYDRLIEYRPNGQPRSAEWFYGPQLWRMHHLRLSHRPGGRLADRYRLTAAWQHIEESRHNRNFRQPLLNSRTEQVGLFTFNADAEKEWKEGKHQLFYGAEVAHNKVNTDAIGLNVNTGQRIQISTRYPDGGSQMTTSAAYVSYKNLLSPKTTFTAGLRYNYVFLKALFKDKTFFAFPFSEALLHNQALNGSAGLVHRPDEQTALNLNLSTGFRAPNVDDVAKVFDSEPGSVVVPNPTLRPEYVRSVETTLSRTLFGRVLLSATGYFTYMTNAMVRRPFLLAGQDSVRYDGVMSQVQAIQNTNEAMIYGISATVRADLATNFSLSSTFNYTNGRDLTDELPLRAIPPVFGETLLRYTWKKWRFDAEARYNGWRRFADLDPTEQAKTHLMTPEGYPAWVVFNLRASVRVLNYLQLHAAVENLADAHYRSFSSGISGPGRNFLLAARVNF